MSSSHDSLVVQSYDLFIPTHRKLQLRDLEIHHSWRRQLLWEMARTCPRVIERTESNGRLLHWKFLGWNAFECFCCLYLTLKWPRTATFTRKSPTARLNWLLLRQCSRAQTAYRNSKERSWPSIHSRMQSYGLDRGHGTYLITLTPRFHTEARYGEATSDWYSLPRSIESIYQQRSRSGSQTVVSRVDSRKIATYWRRINVWQPHLPLPWGYNFKWQMYLELQARCFHLLANCETCRCQG